MAAEKRKPYITEATQADVKGSGANAENCQVQQVLDTETKVPRARLPTCPAIRVVDRDVSTSTGIDEKEGFLGLLAVETQKDVSR